MPKSAVKVWQKCSFLFLRKFSKIAFFARGNVVDVANIFRAQVYGGTESSRQKSQLSIEFSAKALTLKLPPGLNRIHYLQSFFPPKKLATCYRLQRYSVNTLTTCHKTPKLHLKNASTKIRQILPSHSLSSSHCCLPTLTAFLHPT